MKLSLNDLREKVRVEFEEKHVSFIFTTHFGLELQMSLSESGKIMAIGLLNKQTNCKFCNPLRVFLSNEINLFDSSHSTFKLIRSLKRV